MSFSRAPLGYSPSPLTQVGFIPIFEVLLSTVSCGADFIAPDRMWAYAGFVCFTGGHLAVVIIALVLAVVFAAFVAIFAFVFVDSNPLSPGLEGLSSGRAAVLMLFWKVRATVDRAVSQVWHRSSSVYPPPAIDLSAGHPHRPHPGHS